MRGRIWPAIPDEHNLRSRSATIHGYMVAHHLPEIGVHIEIARSRKISCDIQLVEGLVIVRRLPVIAEIDLSIIGEVPNNDIVIGAGIGVNARVNRHISDRRAVKLDVIQADNRSGNGRFGQVEIVFAANGGEAVTSQI